MSQRDLSICIVNWNQRDLLRQCLASIEQAAGDLDVEVVVVDNGSTDGSGDMVAREFPQAVLIRNEGNRGFARASNQAAAISRGRYLLFLNNDTIVGGESLRKLLEFMQANPRAGMVGPRLLGRDGRPQRSYRSRPTLAALLHRLTFLRWTGLFHRAYERYRREDYDHPLPTLPRFGGGQGGGRQVDALLGAAVCLPREVFAHHGGWDEEFPFGLEDLDLSTRVARTHEVVFFPGAEITHLSKMSSRRNRSFAFTGVECGYARYLRKHLAGRGGAFLYKLLFTLNLPLALAVELCHAGWRRLRRGPAPTDRPHSELVPLWDFSTRGIGAFWGS